MLRSLSEEVVVSLKDRLRHVRTMVRQSRHDHPGGPRKPTIADPLALPPEVERLLGRAASMVDDTLTAAETVSRSLLPIVRGDDGLRLHGLDRYFPADPHHAQEGERLFRRDLYAAFRAAGQTDGRPVHEADFAQAHQAIRRTQSGLLAAMHAATEPAERLDAVAAVAAALVMGLLASRPSMSEHNATHPDLAALTPIVLASAIVTLSPAENGAADLIEAAALASEARAERIAKAVAGTDPARDLAVVFAMLLAHLP